MGLALGGVAAVYLGGVLSSVIGWRFTLVAVGRPGLVFALLLGRLRDPAVRAAPARVRHPAARYRFTRRAAVRAALPLLISLLLATAAYCLAALFEALPPNADTLAFGVIAGVGAIWSVFLWVRLTLRHQDLLQFGRPMDLVDEMVNAAALVLRTPTLIWLFLGGALTSAAMNTLVAWSTSFLQRELGMTLVEACRQIGPAPLTASSLVVWRTARGPPDGAARGRPRAEAPSVSWWRAFCFWMLLVESRVCSALFFVVVFFTRYNGRWRRCSSMCCGMRRRSGAYVFFIRAETPSRARGGSALGSVRPAPRAPLAMVRLQGVVLLFALFTVGRDNPRQVHGRNSPHPAESSKRAAAASHSSFDHPAQRREAATPARAAAGSYRASPVAGPARHRHRAISRRAGARLRRRHPRAGTVARPGLALHAPATYASRLGVVGQRRRASAGSTPSWTSSASSAAMSITSPPATTRGSAGPGGGQAVHLVQAERYAVHDLLGHHPIGRELPAGDGDEPRRTLLDPVLAGHRRRTLAAAAQERPQPGPRRHDIIELKPRVREDRIRRAQEVHDVFGRGRDAVRRLVRVRIGRAEHRAAPPREDEHHAAVDRRGERHGTGVPDSRTGHHDMHALGGSQQGRGGGVIEASKRVGPGSGGVDHTVRSHGEPRARQRVH
jgi:hypothetical protein